MVIIQLFGLEERQRNNYFSGQSRYLTAGDVHVPGPLSEFKVCKSCFGSVAPTCKKNKQCLAEKAFAFDPNQPRDERGRWAG